MQPKNFAAQLEELAAAWWNPCFVEAVQDLSRLTGYLAAEAFRRRLDYDSKEARIIHRAQELFLRKGSCWISEEEPPVS